MPKETIKPLKAHLADLKDAKKRKSDIEKEIARIGKSIIDMCPNKVGDIVKVTGWSHTGKKMSITRIAFDPVGPQYVFNGLVIKADGTPGRFKATSHLAVK